MTIWRDFRTHDLIIKIQIETVDQLRLTCAEERVIEILARSEKVSDKLLALSELFRLMEGPRDHPIIPL